MLPTVFFLAGAALVGTGYWLGVCQLPARLADTLLDALRRVERWTLQRGRSHPFTWYSLQAVYVLQVAADLVCAPRATTARLREWYRLRPSRLPQEIIDAIAETALLHLPESHSSYDYAVFNVRRGPGHNMPVKHPDSRVTLPYVYFVGHAADPVHLCLGTPHGPFNKACQATDTIETKDKLLDSFMRVRDAINDLAPQPVLARLYIPLRRA